MENKEVKKIIASYTSVYKKLKKLEPEFEWSNLIGDYGEYVAINTEKYRLKKAPTGQDKYDAVYKDGLYKGKTVQIKTSHKTKSINFSGGADHLLVIKLDDNAEWKELYWGRLDTIKKRAYFSKKTKKYSINLSMVKKIAKGTLPPKEELTVTLKTGKELKAKTRRELRQKLINKGHSVPSESTINARMKRYNWEIERAFGIKVPPNYSKVEHYVEKKGYSWFPKKPINDRDREPLVHHPEKRVYISQNHFSDHKGIPSDYVSDNLKKGWDSSRIIESYEKQKK
tara:strand:+ start:66 stop:917 length:852 start_codon:yes stop_codon:yes gene_type:complete